MKTIKKIFDFTQAEIKTAFEQATLKDKVYGLKLLQAPTTQDFGKILIVIPKKVGSAPVRNKIKRQVKAIFYEERLYENPITSILLVYKAAAKMDFEQIKAFLTKNLTWSNNS